MHDKLSVAFPPIISFDIYFDRYRRLLRKLRQDSDVNRLKSLLDNEMGGDIENYLKDQSYDALVVTNPDQSIHWVDAGFEEMTGYSKKYAVGKRPSFLQGPQTTETSRIEIREALKTGNSYSGTILNYRKNGEAYQCYIKIIPLYNSHKDLIHFLAVEQEIHAA